jgi:Spy/CpxP family protein refolding chaperone
MVSNPESKPEGKETAQEGGPLRIPVDIKEKFDESEEERIDRVSEKFSEKKSHIKEEIGERALSKISAIEEKQKRDIKKMYARRKEEFVKTKTESRTERETLAEELLKKAEGSADRRIRAIEGILASKVAFEYMTSEEVFDIDKAILAFEKVEANYPELLGLLELLFKKDRKLEKQHFEYIARIINPYEITKKTHKIEEAFETSAAGLLIGLMTEEERVRLVEVFMESEKKDQSAAFIEGLLEAGLISDEKGRELLKKAVSEEVFNAQFRQKFEKGYYEQQRKANRDIVEQQLDANYRGNYQENIMNRIVGKPLLGLLIALWGTVTVAINVWANRKDLSKIGPYAAVGLGAMAAGTEMATGTIKKGAEHEGTLKKWGFGRGAISTWLFKKSETAEKEASEKEVMERARTRLAEIYANADPALRSFLGANGIEDIAEIRKRKEKKEHKSMLFTLEDLTAYGDEMEYEEEKKVHLDSLIRAIKAGNESYKANTLRRLTELSEINHIFDKIGEDSFEEELARAKSGKKPEQPAETSETLQT